MFINDHALAALNNYVANAAATSGGSIMALGVEGDEQGRARAVLSVNGQEIGYLVADRTGFVAANDWAGRPLFGS